MNVKLLRRIQKHILAEPLRYNQNKWLLRGTHDMRMVVNPPACKTVGCIAGWATVLSGRRLRDHMKIRAAAQKLLGLSETKAARLFSWAGQDWAEGFRIRLARATTPDDKALAASDYIDHFIKTKGAE